MILSLGLFLTVFYSFGQTCERGLNGTYKIGATGTFRSLSSALDTLRSRGALGPVILELQSSYSSTNESFPINFSGINCLSSSNRLTVRPEIGVTGLHITTYLGPQTMLFDNARFITIDGRPGSIGATTQLKISNTAQNANAITFQNGSSYNQILYTSLSSSSWSNKGNVYFGTSDQNSTSGNSNNEISNCTMVFDLSQPSSNAICSEGSPDKKNSFNLIKDCSFVNFVQSGIALKANNSDWQIKGNHFFGRQWTQAAIFIEDTTSSGFNIIDNYIGGTGPYCSGAPLDFTHYFEGILLHTGKDGYTSIQNNTISNINLTADYGPMFQAIHMVKGKFRCGDIKGNIIGSETSLRSINLITNSIFSQEMQAFGILAGNESSYGYPDTVIIKNNIIGGILGTRKSGGGGYVDFYGICIKDKITGYADIENNLVGHGKNINSIQVFPGSITGISLRFGNPRDLSVKHLVQNNIVANLYGKSTGIATYGYNVAIVNNKVYGLYATYYSTDNGSVCGIDISSSNNSIVLGNIIHTLDSKDQGPQVSGIISSGNNNLLIEKNNIHSLQARATTSYATFSGIIINEGNENVIKNNMIRLGIDTLGNHIIGDHLYQGILLSAENSLSTHNSVYIGGTGNNQTYAFYSRNFSQRVINNIFQNAHSSTNSTYKNYCFYYTGDSLDKLYSNYNLYYANGINGVVGAFYSKMMLRDGISIDQWRSVSKNDSNSMVYDPHFKNSKGTVVTGDLHLDNPTPAEGQGFSDGTFDDFDDEVRGSKTPSDIGADAGNFVLQDGDAPVFSHKSFIGQVISEAQSYDVTIKDNGGGVDTLGSNKPRMWYRKSYPTLGAWVSVAGDLQSGTPTNGNWRFTPILSLAGNQLNPGDSLQYYFVAQDKGPVINIGYSNKQGAQHSTVNNQLSAPAAPLSLLLMEYFPDTVYVGNSHIYPSLTNRGGFFEASNKMIFKASTQYPVVYITSDLLSESGAFQYLNHSASRNTITITTPDTVVKKVKNNIFLPGELLILRNAHNLLFDGSVNGRGRYLQFTNENDKPNWGHGALSILGSADSIEIRNCIFESNMDQLYGAVVFSYTSQVKGLRFCNNHIRNIELGNYVGMPQKGLLLNISNGDSIVIRNNEFSNFSKQGLVIEQGAFTPNVTIVADSNHFYYNTAQYSFNNRTAIASSVNTPVLITNNFIGGSEPFCGGSPWTFNKSLTQSLSFTGIEAGNSINVTTSIKNNVIQNFNFTAPGYFFYGIRNNGDTRLLIERNFIGDTAINSNIFNVSGVNGITVWNSKYPQIITGNIIGGITADMIEGVSMQYGYGLVDSNVVTHLRTQGSSILYGYKIGMNNGKIVNNMASDLISTNGLGNVVGFNLNSYGWLPNEVYVERNRVFGLQSVGNSNVILTGLKFSEGQFKIRNNAISITNGGDDTNDQIYGMYFNGSIGNGFKNEVDYNSIYLSGVSAAGTNSAGIYVDGGSPINRFRNNIIYNERSGEGVNTAISLNAQNSVSDWVTGITNNNIYITGDTGRINEIGSSGVLGFPDWKRNIKGDDASYAVNTMKLPASRFFIDAPNGDLHINILDSLSWYVNGKGLPISLIDGDMDSNSGVRSTAIISGATDIGADEFSTSSLPPILEVTGNHVPNGIDSFILNQRVVATIQWGSSGTLPEFGAARYYSGVWPNDTTNNGNAILAKYLNAFWDIPAFGGSDFSYSITLYYDSSILGKVTNAASMIGNKRQPGTSGSWVDLQPTIVDTVAKIITIKYLNSFSEFSASDSIASLAQGAKLSDLLINIQNNSQDTIFSGTKLSVAYTEKNIGKDAAKAHRIGFYLSKDSVLTIGDKGDLYLDKYENTSLLSTGLTTEIIQKQIFIPCNLEIGSYYIFAVADDQNQIEELNKNNNVVSLPITITKGIEQSPIVSINALPSAIVCNGTSVLLSSNVNDSSNCVYTWSNGANSSSISVTASGTYSLTVSNGCGSVSVNQDVIIKPIPSISLQAFSSSICKGNSVLLMANGSANYSWGGTGIAPITVNTIRATPASAGTHVYTVTAEENGCSTIKTVNILVDEIPTINVSPLDTTICAGAYVNFLASGGQSYIWSPTTDLNIQTDKNVIAKPDSTTTYTVTGFFNGCKNSVSRTVAVMPKVVPSLNISYSGCATGNLVFNAVANNGGNNPLYQWYVNNNLQTGSGASFQIINPINGTNVYATMNSSAACATPSIVNSPSVVINCVTTAVPFIDGLEKFDLGPNPTNGLLTVSLRLNASRKLSFNIIDSKGVNVKSILPLIVSGSYSQTIDLSNLSEGLYFLNVSIGSKNFTEKVIVRRN